MDNYTGHLGYNIPTPSLKFFPSTYYYDKERSFNNKLIPPEGLK